MGEDKRPTMPRWGTRHQVDTTEGERPERLQQIPFRGFNPPTSNTTYTPNQLFDVALVHSSRGCFRLVAYMLRKTLGWCDADGNPQEPEVLISYNDLVQKARVARGIIRKSLDEAIEGHFIECVREGRPSLAGTPAITPLFRLKWDHSGTYTAKPGEFRGFYALEGYRTYVPNQFFDHVVPNEQLAVVKVVGAIIRNTIGWQNEYGFRRQRVQISYTVIQRLSNLSRRALRLALSEALARNYIVRLKEGVFSPDSQQQEASTYGLKWFDHADLEFAHEVQEALENQTGSKSTPGVAQEDRFKKYPRTSSINTPENRFKKYPTFKIKQENKTFEIKQQQLVPQEPVAAVTLSDSNIDGYQLLTQQGFSKRDATALAVHYPPEQIQNQINWLKKRNPSKNPLGLLRRAIEENWGEPTTVTVALSEFEAGLAVTFARNFYAGRNGSDDEPVGARPSANDLVEADRFVERLLTVISDESKIPELGRRFGERIAETDRRNEHPIISLVNSLRTQGNAFYQEVKSQQQLELRMIQDQAQSDHFEQFEPRYLEFVREHEAKAKREEPDRYQRWFEKVQKGRFTFSAQKTDKGRLYAFARDAKLPDFWQWDQEQNPEAFDRNRVGT
jgi:hypothetical protein